MMMDGCSVMQSGFTLGYLDYSSNCLKFLFPSWNIDSDGKYFAVVIGIFLLAFLNEFLTYTRSYLSIIQYPNKTITIRKQIILSISYGIQMFLAYSLMLTVMLYEPFFFISLLLGLSTGNFVFSLMKVNNTLFQFTREKNNNISSDFNEKFLLTEQNINNSTTNNNSNESIKQEFLQTNTPCCTSNI